MNLKTGYSNWQSLITKNHMEIRYGKENYWMISTVLQLNSSDNTRIYFSNRPVYALVESTPELEQYIIAVWKPTTNRPLHNK